MAISCPTCGTPADVAESARETGRLVRCRRCGTSWVARARPEDRFGRRRKLALPDFSDVSDAIVIEDEPAPEFSRPSLPPQAVVVTATPARRLRPVLRVTLIAVAATLSVAALKTPIMAALPQPGAAVAAKAGLQFRNIRSQTIVQGNTPTVVVEGEVVNTAAQALDLPLLKIVLKASDGSDITSWLLDPAVRRLAPGQAIGFRSARAAPPASATQVALSLAAEH